MTVAVGQNELYTVHYQPKGGGRLITRPFNFADFNTLSCGNKTLTPGFAGALDPCFPTVAAPSGIRALKSLDPAWASCSFVVDIRDPPRPLIPVSALAITTASGESMARMPPAPSSSATWLAPSTTLPADPTSKADGGSSADAESGTALGDDSTGDPSRVPPRTSDLGSERNPPSTTDVAGQHLHDPNPAALPGLLSASQSRGAANPKVPRPQTTAKCLQAVCAAESGQPDGSDNALSSHPLQHPKGQGKSLHDILESFSSNGLEDSRVSTVTSRTSIKAQGRSSSAMNEGRSTTLPPDPFISQLAPVLGQFPGSTLPASHVPPSAPELVLPSTRPISNIDAPTNTGSAMGVANVDKSAGALDAVISQTAPNLFPTLPSLSAIQPLTHSTTSIDARPRLTSSHNLGVSTDEGSSRPTAIPAGPFLSQLAPVLVQSHSPTSVSSQGLDPTGSEYHKGSTPLAAGLLPQGVSQTDIPMPLGPAILGSISNLFENTASLGASQKDALPPSSTHPNSFVPTPFASVAVTRFSVGGQTVAVDRSGLEVAGHVLTLGGQPITVDSTPISLGISTFVIGDHTETLEHAKGTSTTAPAEAIESVLQQTGATIVHPSEADQILSLGSTTLIVNPTDFVVAGHTLLRVHSTTQISGNQFAFGTSEIVIGSIIVPLAEASGGSNSIAPILSGLQQLGATVLGSTTEAPSLAPGQLTSPSKIVINDHTLGPGSPEVEVSGTPISLGSSALVIGTNTIRLPSNPTPANTASSVFTFDYETITGDPFRVILISRTLQPGDPAVTISGTVVSLSSDLVIGAQTDPLPTLGSSEPVDIGAAVISKLDQLNASLLGTETVEYLTLSGSTFALTSSFRQAASRTLLTSDEITRSTERLTVLPTKGSSSATAVSSSLSAAAANQGSGPIPGNSSTATRTRHTSAATAARDKRLLSVITVVLATVLGGVLSVI